jgi:hypothetical protein
MLTGTCALLRLTLILTVERLTVVRASEAHIAPQKGMDTSEVLLHDSIFAAKLNSPG